MIKINLALRKSSGASSNTSALSNIDTSAILSPSVRWIVISAVIYFGVGWYFDNQKNVLLQRVSQELDTLSQKSTDLKASLGKMKQYDEAKKALESDEKIIKTKLETISLLSKDRDAGIQYLRAISRAIPKEVWLTSVQFTPSEVAFRGQAIEFNLVSDFTSQLSQTQLFLDVQQESAANTPDEGGKSVVAFELKGRRK
jgi:Tfp pilus assembly protein PilN